MTPLHDIAKWNFKTKQYEPYSVPETANIKLYSNNMNEVIDCTNCFKPLDYGYSYTSRTLHNSLGLGYPVCSDCYQKEWQETHGGL